MSGRRYIITRAMQLPADAPTSAAGRRRVEKLVRQFYSNAAMAEEYEAHPEFTDIIGALHADEMSAAQLQFLLDKTHD
jgi:hypothetical protein